MIWQDLIFTLGSVFSIVVLAPTLTDRMANIPVGTSLPSAVIGLIYGTAFLSMGMTFSAAGSMITGIIWMAIAALRSPTSPFSPTSATQEASHTDSSGSDPAPVRP